jgi:integral membrane protein
MIALVEGLSWLILIGAMVYRSQTGNHDPVAWTGRVHGGLFCLFALMLFLTWMEASWSVLFSLLIGLSSVIPFGFLLADPFLKKKLAGVR